MLFNFVTIRSFDRLCTILKKLYLEYCCTLRSISICEQIGMRNTVATDAVMQTKMRVVS